MPDGKKTPKIPFFAAFLVFAALIGLALAPQYPGFWLIPLALALIITIAMVIVRGPAEIKSDLNSLFAPSKRRSWKTFGRFALASAVLLALGSFTFLPLINPAAPKEATLTPETVKLLAKLTTPVKIEVRLGRDAKRSEVGHLINLYQRAAPLISATINQAEGLAEVDNGEVRVARADSAVVSADGFSETISPIAQSTVNASLRRLISPNRLVYNLIGEGEKSVLDRSPMGLSNWAESLMGSKVYLQDLAWPGPNLPNEALAAGALILAGPRRPLGEEKEKALINFLARGGRLMILHDPLVIGLDPEALSPLGLSLAWGLAVDPEAAWAGTDDYFIVGQNFPAHPLTLGLVQPVVWPLAGAINPKEGFGDNSSPEPNPLTGHTWAVAMSSDSSWLETDLESISGRNHRFQAGQDPIGPLVLATATTLTSSGRLTLTADADLAANGFLPYAGNLNFVNNMLFWLLGAEDDLALPSSGIWLDIDKTKARLLFWLPTVFWPIAVVVIWYFGFRRPRLKGK
jgi:hypothetical protein